jgi:hypothetical protein
MKISLRTLFKKMNSSDNFDLDRPIPDTFVIDNAEDTLLQSGLIIITPQRPNNAKYLVVKWLFLLSLLTTTFKFLILTQIDTSLDQNRKWIFILGDVSFIISEMRNFYLVSASLAAMVPAFLVYEFCFTRYIPCLELFHFLDGTNRELTPRRMGITDMDMVKEMIARYKILMKFSHLFLTKPVFALCVMIFIEFYIKTRNMWELVYISFWLSFCYLPLYYLILKIILSVVVVFYISTFYINLRARQFNIRIDRILNSTSILRKFGINFEARFINREYVTICRIIKKYDEFFNKMYSLGILVSIPLSLISMNLILFKTMNYFTFGFYLTVMIICWTIVFWLSYLLAINHSEVRKSYKKLCKLQWRFNNISNGIKIKVRCQIIFLFLVALNRLDII